MKIAIIPARGGSKRILLKNIKFFHGKPIIAYSIEAAIASEIFDRIIVSTESFEIAEIAKKYGADVPFIRPENLADDYSDTEAVILHAIEWLIAEGFEVEYICCIYATAPFITPHYINDAFNKLCHEKASSLFSVTTFPSPVLRALKINEKNRLEMFWPEYLNYRSQDLPEAYHDAGLFYWAEKDAFLSEKTFYTKNAAPFIIPRYLVQDIDTVEDWERAEMLYKLMGL